MGRPSHAQVASAIGRDDDVIFWGRQALTVLWTGGGSCAKKEVCFDTNALVPDAPDSSQTREKKQLIRSPTLPTDILHYHLGDDRSFSSHPPPPSPNQKKARTTMRTQHCVCGPGRDLGSASNAIGRTVPPRHGQSSLLACYDQGRGYLEAGPHASE